MFYEAVPKDVASLISRLSSFPLPNNTYMAGGTAVTLYLRHRVSIDVDLFTQEHFLTGPIYRCNTKGPLSSHRRCFG
ncbi:MAG: nucleotidyl transferase AbiEii/AbiGii toxin family protein [Deltaproteobacteria bacterium]|nr:nucleotidyl transferase AbiEii/AbiGii toxin family protein [Deltaproteobacteria bacterium]